MRSIDMGRSAIAAMTAVFLLVSVTLVPALALALSPPLPSHVDVEVGPWEGERSGYIEENETNVTDPLLEIGHKVHIKTSWGDIMLGLYEVGAPITAGNFLNLTRSGFYNGILFHRIIDDFVIQTGDPNTKDNNLYNDGWGGSPETIPLETSPNLTHVDGAVGMARSSEPDSASSQFYICDTPQPHLDGDYAVFAIVVEGMDTVRKIATAETYGYKRPALKDHPIEDIVMESVTVVIEVDPETTADPPGAYPRISGMEVGVGGLFVIGLGFIAIVITIVLVRRIIHRRRTAIEAEDILEVEPLDEEGLNYGIEVEGPGEERGRGAGQDKDWFET